LRTDGLPIFQRRRLWSNRTPHFRWVVAPLLLALSHLLETGRMATEITSERPMELVGR
jgi:hypothetical protein